MMSTLKSNSKQSIYVDVYVSLEKTRKEVYCIHT